MTPPRIGMESPRSLLPVLLSAAFVAGLRSEVIFREIRWHSPCDDRSLEFSTMGSTGKVMHKFRLGPTSTLFVKYDDQVVAYWVGYPLKWDLREEHFFFDQQSLFLKKILGTPRLKDVQVSLVYRLDPSTVSYVFHLRVNGFLLSVCRDGTVTPVAAPELDPAIVGAATQFGAGWATELLIQYAKTLDARWNDACRGLETGSNETDVYALRYDSGEDKVVCSIMSPVQWRHEIVFEGRDVSVEENYGRYGKIFATIGTADAGPHVRFSCNITSPNGMVAIQTLDRVFLPPTTPRVTTRASTRTLSASVTRNEEEKEEATTGGEEGSRENRSSAGRAGVISGVVLVVLAGCAAVALIAFRKKLPSFGSGFRRVRT